MVIILRRFILLSLNFVFLPLSFALQAVEVSCEQGLNCDVFKTSTLDLGSNLSNLNELSVEQQYSVLRGDLGPRISANKQTDTMVKKPDWFSYGLSFYRFAMTIPAPIIFICLWLIAFKLLRLPKPELNRASA
jgi:hypothetical protein